MSLYAIVPSLKVKTFTTPAIGPCRYGCMQRDVPSDSSIKGAQAVFSKEDRVVDDFRTFVSCAEVDFDRERDLARFHCRPGPGPELPHVLEKGSTPPDVDTAFGLVLIRGAILDGSDGLTYATLQSFYEYLILIKTKEFQRN